MVRAAGLILLGIVAALAWLLVWAIALRRLHMQVSGKTPDERRTRLLEIGKLRYVVVFGILGNGVALGLAAAVAVIATRGASDWREAVALLAVVAVFAGGFNGWRRWSLEFQRPAPFPPGHPPAR
jgi:hypothetical protein